MHRRVAEVLRDRFADSAAAEPQLLAHHFTQAGLTEAAIDWWGKAGDQALRRSAFQEAISHLGKAIEMADQGTDLLPPSDRLRLQIAYSNALVGLTGNHSSETKVAFSRARELAAASGTPLERFSIYYGLWAGSYARSETTVMQELSTEMLKDVEQLPCSPESCVAHRVYGATQWVQGNYLGARDHLEQAVALSNPERDRELAFPFGTDIGVNARTYLALALWPLGKVDRARAAAEEAIALATQTEHAMTLAYAHFWMAWFEMVRGDPIRSKPHAEATMALARKHDMNFFRLLAPMAHGWAIAAAGGTEAGWDEVRSGVAGCREQGITIFVTSFDVQLAATKARAGHIDAALAMLDGALAEAEQTKARAFVADGHRIRGRFCSSVTRRIRSLPRKLSSLPSPSRSSRRREPLSCDRRWHWRSSINHPVAPPTPVPCSNPRSRALHQLRSFPKSNKRKNSYHGGAIRAFAVGVGGMSACVSSRLVQAGE